MSRVDKCQVSPIPFTSKSCMSSYTNALCAGSNVRALNRFGSLHVSVRKVSLSSLFFVF